jgi:sRNA-binding carbon storage regulator CsrA
MTERKTITVTRRHGERIFIGDDVIITISYRKHSSGRFGDCLGSAIQPVAPRGSVRVSVTAPEDVVVLREELVLRRHQQSLLEAPPPQRLDNVPRKVVALAHPETKTQADPQASQASAGSHGGSG